MKRNIILIILLILTAAAYAKPTFAVTAHPLYAILTELTGDRADVKQLLPSGSSPHTYEPKPSDVAITQEADALFWIDKNLDGWAIKMPAKFKIEVMSLLPSSYIKSFPEHDEHKGKAEHSHSHEHKHDKNAADPHFWTDPLTVKAVLPGLVAALTLFDPEGEAIYKANAKTFADKLDKLNATAKTQLAACKGKAAIMFHPSFNYFLERYGMKYVGAIETSPGKEPSPKEITELVNTIKQNQVKVVFTEPQLPPRPAEVLAESAGIPVVILDPLGGESGRYTYEEILLSMIKIIAENFS